MAELTPIDTEDYIPAARFALEQVQKGRVWFEPYSDCLDPILDAITALDKLAGLDNARRAKEERDTSCMHSPSRCNGGGYDGCACGPYPITRAYLALDD